MVADLIASLKQASLTVLSSYMLNNVQSALEDKDLIDSVNPFSHDVRVWPLNEMDSFLQLADRTNSCIRDRLGWGKGLYENLFSDIGAVYFGIDSPESTGYLRVIAARKVWNDDHFILADCIRDVPKNCGAGQGMWQRRSEAIPIVTIAEIVGSDNAYFRIWSNPLGRRTTRIQKLGWQGEKGKSIGVRCYNHGTYVAQLRPISSVGFHV